MILNWQIMVFLVTTRNYWMLTKVEKRLHQLPRIAWIFLEQLAGAGGTSWYDFTKALYDARGIQTAVVPLTTAEYPLPAPRPAYAVLTSLQDPCLTLPPWEDGVRAFAAQWNGPHP